MRPDKEMQAIIEKVQKFGEDYNTAIQQQATRFAKVFDIAWHRPNSNVGTVTDFEGNSRDLSYQEAWDMIRSNGNKDKEVDSRYEALMNPFRAAGGIQESDIDNLSNYQLEIDMLNQKLALMEQERKAMVEKAMLIEDEGKREAELNRIQEEFASIEKETRTSLVEARKNQFNAMLEMQNKELEMIRPYMEAMQSFGESFGEAIFGSKEDRQNAAKELLKTVLTTTKNIIQQYLIDLAMKKMVEQQKRNETISTLAMEGSASIAGLTVEGAEATADVAAGTAKATAKEAGKLGLKGLLVGALIGTALSALLGLAMSALNKSKSEVASATGASSGKLVTGMLTYGNGRYPVYADGQYDVQGNDGHNYNAHYEKKLNTGVYRGGAHFGIFSEKLPEAVIDGPTTRRITMDYDGIWKDILSLSKTGSLAPGSPYAQRMNAYANGNLSMIPAGNAAGTVIADNAALVQMIAQNNAIMQQLQVQLSAGIRARMTMFGDDDSLDSSIAKMNRMKRKYGLGK